MSGYYSTATVPFHLAIYLMVVAWSYFSRQASLRHALIFAAIFFNNIVWELGVTVRLDYLVSLAAAALYVGSWRAKRPSEFWWLAAMLAVLLIASVAASVAPAYSIRKLAILAIYVLAAGIILSPAAHGRPMIRVLGEFLAVGNRVLAISLALYGVLLITGFDVGFIKDRGQAWLRGPMLNPNVFGSTAATLFLLNAAIAVRSQGRSAAATVWALVAAACVFLSYTRAAWILGAAFGIWVFVWWLLGSGRIGAAHISLAAVTALAVVTFLPLSFALGFEEKLGSLFELSAGTGLERLLLANEGIQDWLSNPWFGTGFQSYEYVVGADDDPTVWVPSVLFVQLLQYGGTGALLCFLAFLVALHRHGLAALRKAGGWRSGDVLVPLLLGVDLLVVAYQVTSAMVLSYLWFFTLLVAYVAQERLDPAAAGARAEPERGYART